MPRYLGVDVGRRRIGLALSDARAVLARPWCVLDAAATPEASADVVAEFVRADRPAHEEDLTDLSGVVVGLPRRLSGEPTDQTAWATAFATALGGRLDLPVHLQDERLTSHEADLRLRARERDWRARKSRLDAAAAAVILQDFLDVRERPAEAEDGPAAP